MMASGVNGPVRGVMWACLLGLILPAIALVVGWLAFFGWVMA